MKLILFGTGGLGKKAYSFFGGENIFCFCDKIWKKKKLSANKIRFILQESESRRQAVVCRGRGEQGRHPGSGRPHCAEE